MRIHGTVRRHRSVRIGAILLAAVVVASCGSDGGEGSATSAPAPSTPEDFDVGADGATPATLPPDIDQPGPDAVLLDDSEQTSLLQGVDEAMTLFYLQRRFGQLVDLSWADPLIETATGALADAPDDEPLRFAARFLDGDAQLPPSLDATTGPNLDAMDSDAIVAYSLWCDRVELPDDYLDTLRSAGEFGGYDLTHALGGAQLMIENGCLSEDEATPLIDELAVATADLLDVDEVADLELEACAILAWTGRWDLIPADLPERVADAQLPDGGWPLEPGGTGSDRHATVWGLRCALELEFGAQVGPARWIPA